MKKMKPTDFRHRNEMPFLRMLFALIAGILLQLSYPLEMHIPAVLLVIFIFLLWIYTIFKKWSAAWNTRWIAGMMLQLSFCLCGMLVTFFQTAHRHPDHFQNSLSGNSFFVAQIAKPLIDKSGSYKTEVEILSIKGDHAWKQTSGRMLLYFDKDSAASALCYGDLIYFWGLPLDVKGPQNPDEFDYKQFLYFHQVYQQQFLTSGSWCSLHQNRGNKIMDAAIHMRTLFISILRSSIADQRSFAVASALVAGYDDEVDQELLNAFSGAGVLHVLSVSGMHVALIYQGLFLLLGFMNRKKWSRHLLYLFLIVFIWFYALLTGFSPSVARSAVMLSIVILAKWHHANANVFNTIVVTAMALLIYNPFYITEVSFQLSFLAVWGIIFFHPKIFSLYEPASRIIHWVWELTSVSLAAQLMTFPLGLYYFHQFPNYFMLANLLIIPLSGIIIYLCIAVLVFSPVAVLGCFVSTVTGYLLWVLNITVLMIGQLPGSVCDRISVTAFETLVIYMLIASITILMMRRKTEFLVLALALTTVLLTSQLYEKYQQAKQREIVIYSIQKQQAIDLVAGTDHLFLTDSLLASNTGSLRFHVANYWWKLGMKSDGVLCREKISLNKYPQCSNIIAGRHIIFFEGKKIVIADKDFQLPGNSPTLMHDQKIKADYVIIKGNFNGHLKDIAHFFACGQIIIDSSNSIKKNQKWLDESRELELKCYSVLQEGAFIEKF
jgi:competence protein ComEC